MFTTDLVLKVVAHRSFSAEGPKESLPNRDPG